jgi:hypothetical protein
MIKEVPHDIEEEEKKSLEAGKQALVKERLEVLYQTIQEHEAKEINTTLQSSSKSGKGIDLIEVSIRCNQNYEVYPYGCICSRRQITEYFKRD